MGSGSACLPKNPLLLELYHITFVALDQNTRRLEGDVNSSEQYKSH